MFIVSVRVVFEHNVKKLPILVLSSVGSTHYTHAHGLLTVVV